MHELGRCGSTEWLLEQLDENGISVDSYRDYLDRKKEVEDALRSYQDNPTPYIEKELAKRQKELAKASLAATNEIASRKVKLIDIDRKRLDAATQLQSGPLAKSPQALIKFLGFSAAQQARDLSLRFFEWQTKSKEAFQQRSVEEIQRSPDGWVRNQKGKIQSELSALEAVRQNVVKGAEGEELVASTLRGLDDRFWVLHDLRLESEDGSESAQIDHVVVGPSGVFVLETKNWSAGYLATTWKSPFVQTRRCVAILREVLAAEHVNAHVEGLVVPVGANLAEDGNSDIQVVEPPKLCGDICERRERMSSGDIQSVVKILSGFVDVSAP